MIRSNNQLNKVLVYCTVDKVCIFYLFYGYWKQLYHIFEMVYLRRITGVGRLEILLDVKHDVVEKIQQ